MNKKSSTKKSSTVNSVKTKSGPVTGPAPLKAIGVTTDYTIHGHAPLRRLTHSQPRFDVDCFVKGMRCERVSGREFLTSAKFDTNGNFLNSGDNTDIYCGIMLSPFFRRNLKYPLNQMGLLNSIATLYRRYAIRRLRIDYVSTLSSTTGIGIAMTFVSSPSIIQSVTVGNSSSYNVISPERILSSDGSLVGSGWKNHSIEFRYDGPKTWQTLQNVGGAASGVDVSDLWYQGILAVVSTGATNIGPAGYFIMDYDVDLYDYAQFGGQYPNLAVDEKSKPAIAASSTQPPSGSVPTSVLSSSISSKVPASSGSYVMVPISSIDQTQGQPLLK